jgi:hypothetical protein
MMKLFLALLLYFVGFVPQSNAAESTKESLVLLPINGVNLLVADIMNRYSMTAGEHKPASVYSDSFEDYKKRQMEEFEAFKRGNPTPQQIEERKRADTKALADRIGAEENLLQSSFQWALNEGLQNRYQVFYGGNHSVAKLVATGNIAKREYGYFLEFAIKDDSNQVVYSNSALCQQCNEIQIGVKFRELGNVPLPVAAVAVVAAAPSQPAPQPVPVVAAADNCYTDEFAQICIIKAEGGKHGLPSLTLSLKNLTQDKLSFIPDYYNKGLTVTDNDGIRCYAEMDGLTGGASGSWRSVLPGASFNFYWNWQCKDRDNKPIKPTGNELRVSMKLERKINDADHKVSFDVAAKVSDWDKSQ